jgi:hypothetical protein
MAACAADGGPDESDLVTTPFALPFTEHEPDLQRARAAAPVLAAAAVPYGQALPAGFRLGSLLDALDDERYDVKAGAAMTFWSLLADPRRAGLGEEEVDEAVRRLIAALRRETSSLRLQSYMPNPNAVHPTDERLCFAYKAAWALVLSGKAAVPALLEAVRGRGSSVFFHLVAELLGRSRDPRVVEALEAGPPASVRRKLAKALAMGGPVPTDLRRRVRELSDKEADEVTRRHLNAALNTVY